MRKRIFVDMDGTLANFHSEVRYLERMFEKGFFENLKPYQNMVDAINMLLVYPESYEVFILSACVDGEPPYCQEEKNKWIDKYLPDIDSEHRIFTKMGVPKSEYIEGGITTKDVLIDDYNKNLEEWQVFGGKAIKCKNDINHRGLVGPLWSGEIIDNQSLATMIYVNIESCCQRADMTSVYDLDL